MSTFLIRRGTFVHPPTQPRRLCRDHCELDVARVVRLGWRAQNSRFLASLRLLGQSSRQEFSTKTSPITAAPRRRPRWPPPIQPPRAGRGCASKG